jgi:hypothetical protein
VIRFGLEANSTAHAATPALTCLCGRAMADHGPNRLGITMNGWIRQRWCRPIRHVAIEFGVE